MFFFSAVHRRWIAIRTFWSKSRDKSYTGKHISSNGWNLDGIQINPNYTKLLEKAGKLKSVSIGEDGAFFYMAESEDSYLSPDTSKKYPKVTEIYKSEAIRSVIFGHDGAYIVLGTKNDYASDPAILPSQARSGQGVRIQCAALGASGVWAVVYSDNTVEARGVDGRIVEAMRAKPVKDVLLSANSPTKHFIEYIDGTNHRRIWSVSRLVREKVVKSPSMPPPETAAPVEDNVPANAKQNGVYLVLRPLEMEKDHKWLIQTLGRIKNKVGLRKFLVLQHWGVMVDNEYYHLHIKDRSTKIALSLGPLTPATIVVPLWKTPVDRQKRVEIAVGIIKAMGGYSSSEEVEIYEGAKNTLMSAADREKYILGSEGDPEASRWCTGGYNPVANNCINFASSWISQIAAINPDPTAAHWVITEVLRQKALNTADDMESITIDTSVAMVDKTVATVDKTVATVDKTVDKTVATVDKTVAVVDTTVVKVEETTGRAKKTVTRAVTKAKVRANSASLKVENAITTVAKSTATAMLVLDEVTEALKKVIKDPSKIHELQDLIIKLILILLGLPIPPDNAEDKVEGDKVEEITVEVSEVVVKVEGDKATPTA